jgi:branched-chain amino acid transport system permease protein
VNRYKQLAFVISAALSGLAGGAKCLVFESASLTDIYWAMSGEVVLMTLVGGMGLITGPVVGAFVLIAMSLYLAQAGAWVTVIQGAIFVICVLSFRNGIVGQLKLLTRRWTGSAVAGVDARTPAQQAAADAEAAAKRLSEAH